MSEQDARQRFAEIRASLDEAGEHWMNGNTQDCARELSKILDALEWAEEYLTKENEANAALHLNKKVFYSPLTTMIHDARESTRRLLADMAKDTEYASRNTE